MADDVQWLSAEEQHAWRMYLRGVSLVAEKLNQDMEARNGLSLNEYEVLAHLSEAPERSLRMSALADVMVYSRSRLTHTVRRLERDGLVERSSCADDRRGVICTLTNEGYARIVAAAPSHVVAVRRCLVDKLGRDQMLELGRICAQLVDNEDSK